MHDKLKRKLLDLQNQRSQRWDAANAAMEANDQAAYDTAMDDIEDIDIELANTQKLLDKYQVPAPGRTPAAGIGSTGSTQHTDSVEIRNSNEYWNAFCGAIRNGVNRDMARRSDDYHILTDALTEGTDSNGGFLVPVDMQTRINELRRQFVSLRDLITVEPVSTLTGYRVLDTAPEKGFSLLNEMGEIKQDDEPKFSRYDYRVKDYALIVPISNDLLADNDAGLMEYLARWLAKKAVITENLEILKLLATLDTATVEDGTELASVKNALNVTLDPDISLRARFLSNQTSYNVLDSLEDKNGRPLMQPDITAGTGYQIKGKAVTAIANRILKDDATGSPLYVGSFADAITMFDRQVMEVATTNIGGKAWNTNTTEARAIMRFDMKFVDKAAVTALKLAAGKNAGIGG